MKRTIQIKSKKCKTTRKTIFPNEDLANRAMFRAWGHDPNIDIKDMHTYLCPDSDVNSPHWHFGHISYYQKYLEKNGRTETEIIIPS